MRTISYIEHEIQIRCMGRLSCKANVHDMKDIQNIDLQVERKLINGLQ